MPDPNEIRRRFGSLPVKPLSRIAKEHEVWEGSEEGAHFIVSRDVMPPPLNLTVCSLSVSGEPKSAVRIIADFRRVFGEPMGGEVVKNPGMVFVVWDSSTLNQKPS